MLLAVYIPEQLPQLKTMCVALDKLGRGSKNLESLVNTLGRLIAWAQLRSAGRQGVPAAPGRARKSSTSLGDGMRGHAPNAPYDSIISAAGGEALPDATRQECVHGARQQHAGGAGAGLGRPAPAGRHGGRGAAQPGAAGEVESET